MADAVRAATEDDDFLFVRLAGFVFVAVSGVEIRGVGFEFGGAGIDQPVGGNDAFRFALGADRVLGWDIDFSRFGLGPRRSTGRLVFFAVDRNVVDQMRSGARFGDLTVRESEFFRPFQIEGGEFGALVSDLFEVAEEPWIDGGGGVDFFQRPAVNESGLQPENTLGVGNLKFTSDLVFRRAVRILVVETKAPATGFKRAQAFLHAFFKRATDRHRFADRFHRSREDRIGGWEFFERETWDFRDDVIDRRFERRRRDTSDVIWQFIEGVTDGEFCGDFCDWETGCLRGERRAPRNARVHFDDDHPAGFRIGRELDVRAAGFHADLTDHGEGCVTHDLILAVRQRLDRGYGDRIAGVNAHRVDVFNRANDHAVVGAVTHDLHFKFFPAEQRFVDQYFRDRREIEAAGDDFLIFLAVVSNATALAAEGESGPDDQREGSDFLRNFAGFFHRVGDSGARHIEADFDHRLFEKLAVFAFVDRFGVRADHFDTVLFKRAGFEKRH